MQRSGRICTGKEGSEGRQNSGWRHSEGANPGTHNAGVRRVLCCGAASAGIRLQNREPVGQLLRQVAKPERTFLEVAAHLPEKEHQGQGIGQHANHGEYDQRLRTILVHRGTFQMGLRGHGLEHGSVDDPTAAAYLMDKHRRDRTEFQIAGVKIRTQLKNCLFHCALLSLLVPLNAQAFHRLLAYGFDHPNRRGRLPASRPPARAKATTPDDHLFSRQPRWRSAARIPSAIPADSLSD